MRKQDLKHATTGVVITIVVAVFLLASLRAFVIKPPETPAQTGSALFVEKGCTRCHYSGSKDTKMGPGLKGLFSREALPVSGRPANAKNVKKQLQDPYRAMPSFADHLTEAEINQLIAYLETL